MITHTQFSCIQDSQPERQHRYLLLVHYHVALASGIFDIRIFKLVKFLVQMHYFILDLSNFFYCYYRKPIKLAGDYLSPSRC